MSGFGMFGPVVGGIINGGQNFVDTATNAANGAMQVGGAALGVADAAGKAQQAAAGNMVDGLTESLNKVSDAFKNGGLAAGGLELLDQGSLGNFAAHAMEAAGIIPEGDAAHQLASGLVNAFTLNPIAIKDFMEFGGAFVARGSDVRGAHDVPPPNPANANDIATGGYAGSSTDISPELVQAIIDQFTGKIPDILNADYGASVAETVENSEYASDPESEVAKLPKPATFEDLVAAFMIDVIREAQKDAMALMEELKQNQEDKAKQRAVKGAMKQLESAGKMVASLIPGPVGQAVSAGIDMTIGAEVEKADAALEELKDSRQMLMEKLKNAMNRLQQMQQALSNVLNSMHQGAMNSIRNIK